MKNITYKGFEYTVPTDRDECETKFHIDTYKNEKCKRNKNKDSCFIPWTLNCPENYSERFKIGPYETWLVDFNMVNKTDAFFCVSGNDKQYLIPSLFFIHNCIYIKKDRYGISNSLYKIIDFEDYCRKNDLSCVRCASVRIPFDELNNFIKNKLKKQKIPASKYITSFFRMEIYYSNISISFLEDFLYHASVAHYLWAKVHENFQKKALQEASSKLGMTIDEYQEHKKDLKLQIKKVEKTTKIIAVAPKLISAKDELELLIQKLEKDESYTSKEINRVKRSLKNADSYLTALTHLGKI